MIMKIVITTTHLMEIVPFHQLPGNVFQAVQDRMFVKGHFIIPDRNLNAYHYEPMNPFSEEPTHTVAVMETRAFPHTKAALVFKGEVYQGTIPIKFVGRPSKFLIDVAVQIFR